MTTDNRQKSAAAYLSTVRRLAVLTGAGVSKESGIPTFREAQTGLWANYDPETLATREGFLNDPSLVWRWYDSRRQRLAKVAPNPGHHALVELEELIEELTVITQNVDGLHRLAGSTEVIELHGNISKLKCFDGNHPAQNVPLGLSDPPRCHCGSRLRPDVVWFGEALPQSELSQAMQISRQSELMLVIGTSGLVHPAASLPYLAKEHGAKILEINPNRTPITEIADLFLQGPSAEMLPAIISNLKDLKSQVSLPRDRKENR
jgi:NAD-dependent deacetylase